MSPGKVCQQRRVILKVLLEPKVPSRSAPEWTTNESEMFVRSAECIGGNLSRLLLAPK